jgi:hypothetical protein
VITATNFFHVEDSGFADGNHDFGAAHQALNIVINTLIVIPISIVSLKDKVTTSCDMDLCKKTLQIDLYLKVSI